ncbi:MAG: hypothetical protein NTZ35_02725 [Ignavibacteriales bacterium]|nr:hypothetical protein [Ignavibacteriales bacterium]
MKDISSKIEPHIVETFKLIDEYARGANIPFFLVGAGARDLIFAAIFDIPTRRGTLDIDFAVRVKDWSQYERLIATLLLSENTKRHGKIAHRFIHTNGTMIDIIPFGDLESPKGVIAWPPSGESAMSTVGFEEAFSSSEVVRIAQNPTCDIKVCTPPGLAIMKLISWDEVYPARKDDANDIHYILTHYVDAGNEARLYGSDKDIAQSPDFDFSMASPRLLGRDVASIANESTLEEIRRILERETRDDSELRLVQQMQGLVVNREGDLERNIGLLRQLQQGLSEGMAHKRR